VAAGFEVATVTVHGQPTAVGSAGPFTLVVDRPADGFGIGLSRVKVVVRGDFDGNPPVSDEITYEVEIDGDASADRLQELVEHVDRLAEIPNSLRFGTSVRLGSVRSA